MPSLRKHKNIEYGKLVFQNIITYAYIKVIYIYFYMKSIYIIL